jgi:homoserine O-acetyltransferase
MARLLPGGPECEMVNSQYGHDGFLIETKQVGELVARALAQPA